MGFRWVFRVFWVGFFGLVFYCQPCLLLLQLHRVEDAEENLKLEEQESLQNDTGNRRKVALVESNAKCRSLKKPEKGLCGRCLSV